MEEKPRCESNEVFALRSNIYKYIFRVPKARFKKNTNALRWYFSGPPCGGRTHNRQNRNLILYPIELRADVTGRRGRRLYKIMLLLFEQSSFRSFLSGKRQSFFYCLCKLVGAGSASAAAVCAFKTGDELFCRHTLCESCKTLCVAVASSFETNVVHFAVFNFKGNASGANTACFICEFLRHLFHLLTFVDF